MAETGLRIARRSRGLTAACAALWAAVAATLVGCSPASPTSEDGGRWDSGAVCSMFAGTSDNHLCYYAFNCHDGTQRGVMCTGATCSCLVNASQTSGMAFPVPEGCLTSYDDLGAMALTSCPALQLDAGADQ